MAKKERERLPAPATEVEAVAWHALKAVATGEAKRTRPALTPGYAYEWQLAIAGMVGGSSGGYSIGSYLVLVAGNVLVILLEGLSAGIQSLRLNYYEFFSKYFSGSGRAYAPVSLHKSTAL